MQNEMPDQFLFVQLTGIQFLFFVQNIKFKILKKKPSLLKCKDKLKQIIHIPYHISKTNRKKKNYTNYSGHATWHFKTIKKKTLIDIYTEKKQNKKNHHNDKKSEREQIKITRAHARKKKKNKITQAQVHHPPYDCV